MYSTISPLSESRVPPHGDDGKWSNYVIRPSPWIMELMPSWQAHVENVLRDRGSDAQNPRLVRVRKQTRRCRHHATTSSTLIGDLSCVELNTTRKKGKVVSQSHNCNWDRNVFYYICFKFEISSLRKNIHDDIREAFKEIYGLEMDNLGINKCISNIMCNSCRKMLNRWKKVKNREYIKYSIPTIWRRQRCKEDCFFYCNKIKGFNVKYKTKLYISVLHQ